MEPHFHPWSYGFRPSRCILGAPNRGNPWPWLSAHQAVRQLQAGIREGYRWVVDLDLEAFFDRVNHDRLAGQDQ